jgi:hypothetical protein
MVVVTFHSWLESERSSDGELVAHQPNPAVKFAPLRCAGIALKRSPLPSR